MRTHWTVSASLCAVIAAIPVGGSGVAGASPCAPAWSPTVGQPGLGNLVRTMAVFDGELYVGGAFTSAGGVEAMRIARWNGATWSDVGGGFESDVYTLAVFDDGSGPALYAGGTFVTAGGPEGITVSRIARWDGAEWSDVGGGVWSQSNPDQSAIRTLQVYDDGNGPALYAGGTFTVAGGFSALRIARWDGMSWSGVGGGVSGSPVSVDRMTVFNDGNGDGLYVTGAFATAGGVAARNVARWDGQSWSTLSSGLLGGYGYSMAVFNDGRGDALYVGGDFTSAGGEEVSRIARWDGAAWEPLGPGLSTGIIGVMTLLAYDDGSPFAAVTNGGGALFAGGGFGNAGELSVNRIARWNGQEWATVANGVAGGFLPVVTALGIYDGPVGPAIFAGGIFSLANSQPANNIARWSPTAALEILEHPQDESVAAGSPVSLSVVASGTATITYQWRRGGEALADGGRISGATTATLTINPSMAQDSGEYDVLVSNACGPIPSEIATVSVKGRLGDLNGDNVVDVFDLLLLLGAWGECADPPPGECPADLNGDGWVDVFDLLALLGNWG
jgi:hypothetical protein